MIEPVFQTCLPAHNVLTDTIRGDETLESGYDRILIARSKMLEEVGLKKLSVKVPANRALLRLLAMGRVTDAGRARCFAEDFQELTPRVQDFLV